MLSLSSSTLNIFQSFLTGKDIYFFSKLFPYYGACRKKRPVVTVVPCCSGWEGLRGLVRGPDPATGVLVTVEGPTHAGTVSGVSGRESQRP